MLFCSLVGGPFRQKLPYKCQKYMQMSYLWKVSKWQFSSKFNLQANYKCWSFITKPLIHISITINATSIWARKSCVNARGIPPATQHMFAVWICPEGGGVPTLAGGYLSWPGGTYPGWGTPQDVDRQTPLKTVPVPILRMRAVITSLAIVVVWLQWMLKVIWVSSYTHIFNFKLFVTL